MSLITDTHSRNGRLILLLIILNLPYFLVQGLHLIVYRTTHQVVGGNFASLDYFFNLIEVAIVIYGFLFYRKTINAINLYPILAIVLVKDLLLLLVGNDTPFTWNSWEMYLSPLLSMGVISVIGRRRNYLDYEFFIDGLILFNFLYQILFLLTGRVGDDGRVTVMNQGTGSVGMMAAYYIIYILLTRPKNRSAVILIIISLISIVLSGSRFSLLILALTVLLNFSFIFKSLNKNIRCISIIALLLIVGFITWSFSSDTFQQYAIIARMSGMFNSGDILSYIGEDQSFQERLESIEVGFQILKDNPVGISNSFIDIQTQSVKRGFYAFPHSTFLTFYLLWGPVFLFCILWLIKKCMLSYRRNAGFFRFFLVIIVCFTIYGGIETAPKVYVFLFCIFSSMNMRLMCVSNKRR